MREQALGQWTTQIEADERQRMETPTEGRVREWRQEIRDHRHFSKQDGRFRGIVRTIRRPQDGTEGSDRAFLGGTVHERVRGPVSTGERGYVHDTGRGFEGVRGVG
jgi:hypothetical protein